MCNLVISVDIYQLIGLTLTDLFVRDVLDEAMDLGFFRPRYWPVFGRTRVVAYNNPNNVVGAKNGIWVPLLKISAKC